MLDPLTENQAYGVLPAVSRSYPPRLDGFPTCSSPVRHGRPPKGFPFDLHALGTPPALFLSQDQTLHQDCPCRALFLVSRPKLSLIRIFVFGGTRSRFNCQGAIETLDPVCDLLPDAHQWVTAKHRRPTHWARRRSQRIGFCLCPPSRGTA